MLPTTLTVLDHPLIQHKVAILRDQATPTKEFKSLVAEIAMLMTYEVTRDLPLESVEVQTPLETTTGARVAGKKLVLVPILRAGLGMIDTVRLTLATMVARLTPTCPADPRSCASASAGDALRGTGSTASTSSASRGISSSVPSSSRAMAR
jgi:hypothetical protein